MAERSVTPERTTHPRTIAEFASDVREYVSARGNCVVLDIEEERLWFTAHHWIAGQEWCACEQVRRR